MLHVASYPGLYTPALHIPALQCPFREQPHAAPTMEGNNLHQSWWGAAAHHGAHGLLYNKAIIIPAKATEKALPDNRRNSAEEKSSAGKISIGQPRKRMYAKGLMMRSSP